MVVSLVMVLVPDAGPYGNGGVIPAPQSDGWRSS